MAFTGSTGTITAGGAETQDTLKTFLDANTSYGAYEYGGAIVRGASIVVPNTTSLTLNYGECLIFDDAGKHCLQINSGGTVDFKFGGSIITNYNGTDGFNKLVGKLNGENITYRANATVANGRFDHFSTTTSSDGLKNLNVVIGKGAAGFQFYTHLQGLAGKITGLNLINDVTSSILVWAIEFGTGVYSRVAFPSTTSKHGVTGVNVTVALARLGGVTTLSNPSFPGSTYSLNTTGVAGVAYLKNESWPDNSGAIGSFTGAGSTDVYRQFTWSPGTFFTEGGWNVLLRDNQATPTVYQNGVVAASTGIDLTWQYFKNSVATNYYPFKLLARKVGYQGVYKTFTPTAAVTESFLPQVDTTYTSDQSALTGISADNATNTITISAGTKSLDQIYDWFQWWLAQTAQMTAYPTVASIGEVDGKNWTLPAGWTLAVGAGASITEGTKLTYVYAPTITNNGSISCVYGSSLGVSTMLELRGVKPGAGYIVANNATKATILYGVNNTASTQTYTVYFPPGSAGTEVYVARQAYADQFDYEVVTLAPGVMWYQFLDIPDEGITQATLATVQAYTTLETTDKLYDYICAYRMTEVGIKLGSIVTRAGPILQFATYSGVVHKTAASVFGISGSSITLRANGLASTSKYTTIIATPPASWVANTDEVIDVEIEDANGDSSVMINASGVSTFEIWKIPDATPPDNYATGTLLGTAGTGRYRFIGVEGYKMVIRDSTTNFRVTCEMEKGTYEAALYFGPLVQLAQAPDVTIIKNSLALMQVDVDLIKGTGFVSADNSLKALTSKVGEPLQASSYTAPANADVAAIKTKVETLQNTDISGLATQQDAEALSTQIGMPLQAEDYVIPTVPPTAQDNAVAVRAELATELSRLDIAVGSRLATMNYTAPPTPAQNATAVRSELSTELSRMDAAVSSRLASQAYTAPPAVPTAAQNAAAVRTELGTELGRLDVSVGSRLATQDYTAPPTPPTAEETAAAVRSELADELGKLDATVSSRLAEESYTAPATTQDVADAVRSKLPEIDLIPSIL